MAIVILSLTKLLTSFAVFENPETSTFAKCLQQKLTYE